MDERLRYTNPLEPHREGGFDQLPSLHAVVHAQVGSDATAVCAGGWLVSLTRMSPVSKPASNNKRKTTHITQIIQTSDELILYFIFARLLTGELLSFEVSEWQRLSCLQ